jgi:hypothetical protein
MTRKEAILILRALMDNPIFSDEHKAAFNIAIHDIEAFHMWNINELVLTLKKEPEQEPFINKLCISENICEHDKIAALEEVRNEIAEYGSIWVQYVITDKTKTVKGIDKLVEDILKQAKEQVLKILDEYIKKTKRAKSANNN